MLFKYLLIHLPLTLFILITVNPETPSNTHLYKNNATIKAGNIDLSDWHFEHNGIVALDGEWEFYWKEALDIQQFLQLQNQSTDTLRYFNFPQPWNKYTIKGQQLGSTGYANFVAHLTLNPTQHKQLALRIPAQFSAYRLYLNNELIAYNGLVSNDSLVSTPDLKANLVFFETKKATNTLLLQVSNYHHRHGGLQQSILLGTQTQILKKRDNFYGFDFFLFGLLFIMFIYHLVLYWVVNKDRSALYFGLFCGLILVRILVMGETLLRYFDFPISASWLIKIEYISFFLSGPVFIYFLNSLFGKNNWIWIKQSFLAISLLFSTYTIIQSSYQASQAIPPYQLVFVVQIAYMFYLVVRANIKKHAGASWALIGLVITAITAINDIFVANASLATDYWFPVGFIGFIVCYGLVTAIKYVKIERQRNAFKQSYNTVRLLSNIGQEITASLSIESIMDTIYKHIKSFMDTTIFGIGIYNTENQLIEFYNTIENGKTLPYYASSIKDNKNLSVQCFNSKQDIYLTNHNIIQNNYLNTTFLSQNDTSPKSIVYLPLIAKNKAIGVITIQSFKDKAYSINDLGLLKNLAAYAAIALENAQIYQRIEIQKSLIEAEKSESERLLLNILPLKVATELKKKGYATPQSYEMVTMLFTDFQDFSKLAQHLNPEQLVRELDSYFSVFDEIIGNYGLEKIKTIGDAYMCAGGIPTPNTSNPIDAINAALDIQDFMRQLKEGKEATGLSYWNLRIGVHTGKVVAGVVGYQKFAYDIWGDDVNLAARMEAHGEANKVNISGATYQLIKDQFDCKYRGKIQVKHKGEVDMYFVNRMTHHEKNDSPNQKQSIPSKARNTSSNNNV